jgi:hypothetical protein
VPKSLRLRVDKLKAMLLKEYDFKPKPSLEELLNTQMRIDDDEMPVIVDEDEGFISFD